MENIFIFKNQDANLFKNLGKFRFFLRCVTDLRIFFNI